MGRGGGGSGGRVKPIHLHLLEIGKIFDLAFGWCLFKVLAIGDFEGFFYSPN